MSALVILECNSCAAISAPHLSAEKARETEAPEGWTVAIDGEDLDYCPACTAPAGGDGPLPSVERSVVAYLSGFLAHELAQLAEGGRRDFVFRQPVQVDVRFDPYAVRLTLASGLVLEVAARIVAPGATS